ncbi:hypothetical protein JHK82_019354 [Glycine max]|nr:hypothetical protein JHK87_019230 [Glycine soja]KAG5023453.1 hypothetical protein JHK85_019795 [Glycine max]KAG5038530.1 hypothetical protein JHK86_019370 [Glycine max]KAG5143659.1 hypothetical protein JHK82_019354 [Glycine max]KHN31025.1 hypothetical protein glysoja_020323 [Glycine soja]
MIGDVGWHLGNCHSIKIKLQDHGNHFVHFGLERRSSNQKHKEMLMLLLRYGVYTFGVL